MTATAQKQTILDAGGDIEIIGDFPLSTKQQKASMSKSERTHSIQTLDNSSIVKPSSTESTKSTQESSSPIGRFLEHAANAVLKDKGKKSLDTILCNPCKHAIEQPMCFFRKPRPTEDDTMSENPSSETLLSKSASSNKSLASKSQDNRPRSTTEDSNEMPITDLHVDTQDLDRSISELTMKSSYGEATSKISENRRMAYYAVGQHHKAGRGGNRRCYFTGKLILGGAPFYAGSVQQGLRTLIVFCLPSAIGLPKITNDTASVRSRGTQSRASRASSSRASTKSSPLRPTLSRESSIGVVAGNQSAAAKLGIIKRLRTRSTAGSRLSLDEWSLSIVEEDLDPNWGLDKDFLLRNLPEPASELLQEMEERYPTQFETLPVQVKSPHCWRLFCKFCFFSGLPIAEGEMHYKVRDEVAYEAYGEEIILSHEVMEAVNGESAQLLRLPNQKTFRYLRKHYTQQSAKLSDAVFCRKSWEMVRPEI